MLFSPGDTNEFWYFYGCLYDILYWFGDKFNGLIHFFYDDDRWNFLFYSAFFPALAMFVVDIVMSFYLSVRCREVRLFNVISPKSWRTLKDVHSVRLTDSKNHSRDFSLKYTKIIPSFLSAKYLKTIKAGDKFKCRDGAKYQYCGMRSGSQNSVLYAYRYNGKLYYSSLKPSKFATASATARNNSFKYVYEKNPKGG